MALFAETRLVEAGRPLVPRIHRSSLDFSPCDHSAFGAVVTPWLEVLIVAWLQRIYFTVTGMSADKFEQFKIPIALVFLINEPLWVLSISILSVTSNSFISLLILFSF